MRHVLLVDPERSTEGSTLDGIPHTRFTSVQATDPASGEIVPDAIVLVARKEMPATLSDLHELLRLCDVPVIVFGDPNNGLLVREALLAGASDFLDLADLESHAVSLAVECAAARAAKQASIHQEMLREHEAEMERDRLRLRRGLINQLADRLNNPLTILRLQLRLIRGHLRPEGAKHLEQIDMATDRLREIIDQVTEAFQGQTGRIDVHLDGVDLWDVHAKVRERVRETAATRGITLAQHGTSVITRSDGHWVERIMGYMVSQALRLTPDKGHIYTAVRAEGRVAAYEVEVPRALSPREAMGLFDAFSGTDDPDRSHDLGMELYVARLLARHLGGDIVLSSAGNGTRIALHLPIVSDDPWARATIAIIDADRPRREDLAQHLRDACEDVKIVLAAGVSELEHVTDPDIVVAEPSTRLDLIQARWPHATIIVSDSLAPSGTMVADMSTTVGRVLSQVN